MDLFYRILCVVHVFLCVILVISILFQKGTGEGLIVSSNSRSPFSSSEVTSFITKFTRVMFFAFLINGILIAAIGVRISKQGSLLPSQSDSTPGPRTSIPTEV